MLTKFRQYNFFSTSFTIYYPSPPFGFLRLLTVHLRSVPECRHGYPGLLRRGNPRPDNVKDLARVVVGARRRLDESGFGEVVKVPAKVWIC